MRPEDFERAWQSEIHQRESAAAALARIHSLPSSIRRRAQLVVAWCPVGGCRVVTVYDAPSGFAGDFGNRIVDLAGHVDLDDEFNDYVDFDISSVVDPSAIPRHLPRAARWLDSAPSDDVWPVKCRHSVYPISVGVLQAAVAARRARVDVADLAP